MYNWKTRHTCSVTNVQDEISWLCQKLLVLAAEKLLRSNANRLQCANLRRQTIVLSSAATVGQQNVIADVTGLHMLLGERSVA